MIKKHIKKKFLFEKQFTADDIQSIQDATSTSPFEHVAAIGKEHKGKQAFVITDTNKILTGFIYNDNGNYRLIPEPDPVLIFFNTGYMNYTTIAETKTKILKKISPPILTEDVINDLYNFLGMVSGFVIHMFTALEAFINQSISDDYHYERKGNRCTEVFNKEQIERHFSFEDKLKVLHDITKKDFVHQQGSAYQMVINLKEFRDSIIHLKMTKVGGAAYNHIYKKAFDFKYFESLNAVAKFLNFYRPGYIEECQCDKSF